MEKEYDVSNATHKVICVHSYNAYSKVRYSMPCIPLKNMPNGKVKIVVFGDRRNMDYSKKRIRYVDEEKIEK